MGADLLTFIQRFELLVFFSAYPLFYTLIKIITAMRKQKLQELLPVTYALVTTLYFLFVLWQNFRSPVTWPMSFPIVLLRSWSILALLFWIPGIRKFSFGPFLHSLVFFGLIVIDIFTGMGDPAGKDQVRNDMTVFTGSFLLNASAFGIILGVFSIRKMVLKKIRQNISR
jgi:hypothetical protein